MKRKFVLIALVLVILTMLIASRPVDDERVSSPQTNLGGSYPAPATPIPYDESYPAPVYFTSTPTYTFTPTSTGTITEIPLPTVPPELTPAPY